MKITALKRQVKNTGRISVYVDGKYGFSLSLGEVADYKVKQGLELNEVEFQKFISLSEQGKKKARALEWLMRRPHSEREFFDYLRRKKTSEDLTKTWAEEFRQKKYLDDEYFASWFMENRRNSKQASTKKIKYELRSKGIAGEIVEDLLTDQNDEEREALTNLIAKKSSQTKYKNDPQKFIAYLARQGFSYSLIKELLNK